MASDIVTLELNGDVPLQLFANAVVAFSDLIESLSTEVGGGNIEWTVHDLRPGSAVATVRGRSDDSTAVERVVRAYEAVGDALENAKEPPFNEFVSRSAHKLIGILNGKVTSVTLGTDARESTVYSLAISPIEQKVARLETYGAVEGTIETVSCHKRLRFVLYDSLSGQAINCYLRVGEQDTMRDLWGKWALVVGKVFRDPASGKPVAIKHITRIVPAEFGDYRKAPGAFHLAEGEKSEDVIRRLRDA